MQRKFYRQITNAGVAAMLMVAAAGCSNLPGTHGQQGAAIGGVGGAAAGALVGGEHHRLLGALLGGVVGAGGGYLIGANSDRITGRDRAGAEEAVRRAQANPATPQQAMSAPTADLNGDGFVTMDEVVAMRQAGFPDQQVLDKMRATGQVFELSPDQQNYLRTNGVDQFVIDQIPQLNREARDRLLSGPGYPPDTAPSTPPPAYPPSTPPPAVYPPSSTYPAPGPSPNYPQAPGPNTPVPPPPQ